MGTSKFQIKETKKAERGGGNSGEYPSKRAAGCDCLLQRSNSARACSLTYSRFESSCVAFALQYDIVLSDTTIIVHDQLELLVTTHQFDYSLKRVVELEPD